MQAIAQAIAPFAAKLGAVDDEVERTGHILNGLMGHLGLRAEQSGEDPAKPTPVDTIWCCKKCGTRLGMYDEAQDVLRMRYKEFIVHAHAGIGGWIRVICKGCAEMNVIEYATGASEAPDRQYELQVSGDQLLVDEPLLAHLLELVRGNEGRLVVRMVQAPAPDPR